MFHVTVQLPTDLSFKLLSVYGELSGPLSLQQLKCLFNLRNFRLLPAEKGEWTQLLKINETHPHVHTPALSHFLLSEEQQ